MEVKTDKIFWEKYWTNLNPPKIKRNLFWLNRIKIKMPPMYSEFIEIGGFPGLFAGYFKKYYNYKVTILDYVNNLSVVAKLFENNNMNLQNVNFIEIDFFRFNTNKKYDFVFSAGFLEHFDDTRKVILKHYELLAEDGLLFISIPNLLGLNGYIMKKYCNEIYSLHNTECMNLNKLKQICAELKFKEAKVDFWGSPRIWLESPSSANSFIKSIIPIANLLVRLIPLKNYLLSSNIAIIAKK